MGNKKIEHGIDANVLIDCMQNNATMDYVNYKVNEMIAISSIVIDEAYGILVQGGGFSDDEFKETLNQTIPRIGGIKKRYDPKRGDKKSQELLKNYSLLKEGEKDHKILAHYKGIGINVILVRDEDFEKVIEREGLSKIRIPTQEKVREWKLNGFKI